MIANNSLSHLIAEHIIKDILLGKIIPGEKLIESKFAEEFGTSRAPVREAFYLLTMFGFAQKIPRKGTVVKVFTIEEKRDILEIRNFLEKMSLQKMHWANKTKVEIMEQLVEQMENSYHDAQGYSRLNYRFHQEIILSSNSDVIYNVYSQLGTILISLQFISFLDKEEMNKSLQDHKLIVQFLKKGLIEEAVKLLDTHNRNLLLRLTKLREQS